MTKLLLGLGIRAILRPLASRFLITSGLGLTSGYHDMPVVVRHLLLIRIAKEISSDRHIMGI